MYHNTQFEMSKLESRIPMGFLKMSANSVQPNIYNYMSEELYCIDLFINGNQNVFHLYLNIFTTEH